MNVYLYIVGSQLACWSSAICSGNKWIHGSTMNSACVYSKLERTIVRLNIQTKSNGNSLPICSPLHSDRCVRVGPLGYHGIFCNIGSTILQEFTSERVFTWCFQRKSPQGCVGHDLSFVLTKLNDSCSINLEQ